MTLPIFALTPNQSSYSIEGPTDTIQVKLDGGKSRFRRNVLDGTSNVTCSWTLEQVAYDYLWAFYRTAIGRGSLPFKINLILENSELQLYTATFLPNSLQLTGMEGLNYMVSGTLEVTPLDADPDSDQIIIDSFEALGTGITDDFNGYDKIANVYLPELHS